MTGDARRAIVVAMIVMAVMTAASHAFAQPVVEENDPANRARIRFGSLRINPVLNVKNIGIDTNVFNDPQEPKRDFTATVTPLTDIYLRSQGVRVDVRLMSDLVYYRDYDSERSSNTEYRGLVSVPLTVISPYAGGSYTSTRARPGYEVDARARHSVTQYRGGSDVRLGTRTVLGLDLTRAHTEFKPDETFRGQNLAEQLNRNEDVARLSMRIALTPLTRAVAAVEAQRDRFDVNTIRDSDSYRVMAGLELEPVALVSGTATVGYRSMTFRDGSLAGERGLVTAVNVGYTIFALTRLGVSASRDTQYSYDPEHPYYVQSGGVLTLTQQLLSSWDLQLTGGLQNLHYADRLGVRVAGVGIDRVTQYGAGLGYHLGRDTRVGLTYTRNRRQSADPLRRYEGQQFGTSITYGR
jgi:hypothetical protein